MSDGTRVVRVIARLNIGGPARHVTLLNAGLRARGYDTLLVHGDVGEGEGSFEDLVAQAQLPSRRIRGLGRRIDPWSDLRALRDLVRLIFHIRPHVVHTHTAKAGVLGRLAACVYNATRLARDRSFIVHTYHGNVFSGYFNRPLSVLVRLIERLMALVTDRIIVIAEQQRGEVTERFRIAPASKVVVVPLGLDLAALAALDPADRSARAEFGYSSSDIVFGYVGRFVAVKDLGTMIRALAAAAATFPSVRLLMAGDGELRAHVETLAISLGVRHLVRLAGWRRDLRAIYGAVDAAMLSSINEGTPVSLIEAMAAARPVLSTRVGGVINLVRHEVTGLLVPAGDPGQLADGIVRLAGDSELRARLGAAARRDVVTRFAGERLVADISALYETGIRNKRGMRPR